MHSDGMGFRRPWSLPAILAVAAILRLAFAHFTLEDAYIHYTYAAHWSWSAPFQYDGFSGPSSGSTAPLWTALLAQFPTGWGVVIASKLLGLAASLGAIALVYMTARRLLHDRRWAALAALLLALDFNDIQWSTSGMGSGLTVLLVAVFLFAVVGRRWLMASCAVVLAYLVRPEACLLGAVLVLRVARYGRPGELWKLLPLALGPLYLVWHHHYFGYWLPLTAVKLEAWTPPHLHLVWLLVFYPGVGLLAVWQLVRCLRHWRDLSRAESPEFLVALSWAVLFGALLISASYDKRYFVVISAPLAILATLGLRHLEQAGSMLGRSPALRRWTLAGMLGVIALSWINCTWYALRTGAVHQAASRRVAESVPPGAAVATDEIGVLGYTADVRIVDLMGLVTSEAATVPAAEKADWLAIAQPDYLLLTNGALGIESRLADTGVLQPIARFEFRWLPTIYTRSCRGLLHGFLALSPPRYAKTLYRCDWSRYHESSGPPSSRTASRKPTPRVPPS